MPIIDVFFYDFGSMTTIGSYFFTFQPPTRKLQPSLNAFFRAKSKQHFLNNISYFSTFSWPKDLTVLFKSFPSSHGQLPCFQPPNVYYPTMQPAKHEGDESEGGSRPTICCHVSSLPVYMHLRFKSELSETQKGEVMAIEIKV